jgi:hypothetical protein
VRVVNLIDWWLGHTQVGPSMDTRLPIEDLGRNINSTAVGDVLTANPYAMGLWLIEQLRLKRKLGLADFINPAGNRVSATFETLNSAVLDFGADPTITNFINGTSHSLSSASVAH